MSFPLGLEEISPQGKISSGAQISWPLYICLVSISEESRSLGIGAPCFIRQREHGSQQLEFWYIIFPRLRRLFLCSRFIGSTCLRATFLLISMLWLPTHSSLCV